jgi:hypothetical protein
MGALILPVNTALAHCKGSHEQVTGCDGGHPHDGTDPDIGDPPATYYRARITRTSGLFGGTSDGTHPVVVPFWLAGNKKSIGLNIGGGPISDERNVGQLDNLDFFRTAAVSSGNVCFDKTETMGAGPVDGYLGQANLVKGRRGRAEAHFWFLGYTKNGPMAGAAEKILYLLLLIGEKPTVTIPFDDDWPPKGDTSTTMTLDTWELTTQGVGGDIRNNSCVQSGNFGGGTVEIEVCLVGSGTGTVIVSEPLCPDPEPSP